MMIVVYHLSVPSADMYHVVFRVVPLSENEHVDLVEGAYAWFWVRAKSRGDALSKAMFNTNKYNWKITGIELPPVPVSRETFADWEPGLEAYDNAQSENIATVYTAWSRDGTTELGPLELSAPMTVKTSDLIQEVKKNKERGRCLHYDSGQRCTKVSRAHSIQKQGLLSRIAIDGHVYTLSGDIGTLQTNKGKAKYKKVGIGKTSTFLGFCNFHDNELFGPIDNLPLEPTDEQVFLYAYRSLCREVFVKENALRTVEYFREESKSGDAAIRLAGGLAQGFRKGLQDLQHHKAKYDESLRCDRQTDIDYVLFTSSADPNIAFSGLVYPDYDFTGEPLQNLADQAITLQLLTFCSGPTRKGWGFLLAWHKSSSIICERLIDSLEVAVTSGQSYEDSLFRLTMHSENHAVSPNWWDLLPQRHKETIVDTFTDAVDLLCEISSTWLAEGLEGISGWKFERRIRKDREDIVLQL